MPLIFLDEFQELEPYKPSGPTSTSGELDDPSHSVTAFEQLCRISTITDHILCDLYAEKSSQRDPHELLRSLQDLHAELVQWRKSLPTHLAFRMDASGELDTTREYVALPHILYLA